MNYPVRIEALKGKCTFLDIATGQPVVDGKGRPQINRDYPVADGSEYVSDTVMVLEQVEPTKPEITDIQRLTRGEWVYDQAAQTASRPYVVVDIPADESKQTAFQVARDAGFNTGLGYSLGLQDQDRADFTSLLTLLTAAGAQDEMETSIADTEGVLHPIKVGALKPLLVQYGLYFQGIWAASK